MRDRRSSAARNFFSRIILCVSDDKPVEFRIRRYGKRVHTGTRPRRRRFVLMRRKPRDGTVPPRLFIGRTVRVLTPGGIEVLKVRRAKSRNARFAGEFTPTSGNTARPRVPEQIKNIGPWRDGGRRRFWERLYGRPSVCVRRRLLARALLFDGAIADRAEEENRRMLSYLLAVVGLALSVLGGVIREMGVEKVSRELSWLPKWELLAAHPTLALAAGVVLFAVGLTIGAERTAK